MKKQKGRALEGKLVDSLLDPKQQNGDVYPSHNNAQSAVSIAPSEPDLDLGLTDEERSLSIVRSAEPVQSHELLEPSESGLGEAEDKTYSIPMPQATQQSSTRATSANEPTVRLNSPRLTDVQESEPSVRVGFGFVPTSGLQGATDAHLAQSESLRIAQARISQLEEEIERLRKDNHELASAGELLRRRADESTSEKERVERHQSELETILQEEKAVFQTSLMAKEREVQSLKSKIEGLEARLENDFKRIRVRERDLEHRLELMKLETATTIRNKDELILDLKRKIDQLTAEAENYRTKGQDLYKSLDEKQETMRRVVRALRIALSIIEGEEEPNPLKKVD